MTNQISSAKTRKAARYYVVEKSLWQADDYKLVAGPLSTRKEANDEAGAREISESDTRNEHGMSDLTGVRITAVLTHTECVRHFGKNFMDNCYEW